MTEDQGLGQPAVSSGARLLLPSFCASSSAPSVSPPPLVLSSEELKGCESFDRKQVDTQGLG